jgi:hypothetical protein
MLLRLFMIAAVAFGMVRLAPAHAQTQPQIQTLGNAPADGTPAPRPKKQTAAEKRAKRAACLEQAKQQNLRGKARSTFVKNCVSSG